LIKVFFKDGNQIKLYSVNDHLWATTTYKQQLAWTPGNQKDY
jgi:hypothetical protein